MASVSQTCPDNLTPVTDDIRQLLMEWTAGGASAPLEKQWIGVLCAETHI